MESDRIENIRFDHADKRPQNPIRNTKRSRYRKRDGAHICEVEVYSTIMPVKAIITYRGEDSEYMDAALCCFANGSLNKLNNPTEDKLDVTLKDVIQGFYDEDGEYLRRRNIKKMFTDREELKSRRAVVNRTIEKYGGTYLPTLSDKEFQLKFIEELLENGRVGKTRKYTKMGKKELAPKTVRNILTILSVAYQTAVDAKITSNNPFRDMVAYLPSTNDVTYATPSTDILMKVLTNKNSWQDPVEFAMITFLATTGLRIDEAIALRSEDIDLENRVIHVRTTYKAGAHTKTKTRTERMVPIGHLTEAILKPLVSKNGYVFSITGHKPFSRIKYAKALTYAFVDAGLSEEKQQQEGYVLHSLRHYFISRCVSVNVSDVNISLITGHDTAKISSMNLRYTQILMDSIPMLVNAIDEFFPMGTQEKIRKTYESLWNPLTLSILLRYENRRDKLNA